MRYMKFLILILQKKKEIFNINEIVSRKIKKNNVTLLVTMKNCGILVIYIICFLFYFSQVY